MSPMLGKPALLAAMLMLVSACSASGGVSPVDILPQGFAPSSLPNMRILDSKMLHLQDDSGTVLTELSGISWDQDEQVLYAVSDEGHLYHLAVELAKDKISGVKVLKSMRLLGKKGKPLKRSKSDSEGLSATKQNNGIKGDTRLLVSFEGKNRIAEYRPDGSFIRKLSLPKALRSKKAFKGGNKGLESVTLHPELGLVTTPEYPLKTTPEGQHCLYLQGDKQWCFKRGTAKNSAVTGLENYQDGVLVLERAWSGIENPLQIRLSLITGKACQQTQCVKQELADLSSADGWYLDNFEGLAALGEGRYLMVSDDNQKSLQKTLLVLFEITLDATKQAGSQ